MAIDIRRIDKDGLDELNRRGKAYRERNKVAPPAIQDPPPSPQEEISEQPQYVVAQQIELFP
jgi:hypothetical protein